MKTYKPLVLLMLLPLLIFLGLMIMGLIYQGARSILLRRPGVSFPLDLKWQVDLGSSTYERPVYQNGLVLLPANNSIFSSHWYGIEANTGQISWSQPIGRYNFRRCLTEQYLVISNSQSLFVLEIFTGKIVLKKEERADRAACSEEIVFFTGAPRDSIDTVKFSTGQRVWGGTEPQKSFNGLVYNPETKEVIASESTVPEELYIVDPKSGRLLRSFKEVGSAPNDRIWQRGPMYVVDHGQLFIGETVLDAETGQVIHKEDRYRAFTPPTVTADTMYISNSMAGVIAMDRKDYTVKWIYKPQFSLVEMTIPSVSPVVTLDEIGYVILADATLRAFDIKTGQEVGRWQPGFFDLWSGPNCQTLPPTPACLLAFAVEHDTDRAGLVTSEDTLFVSFGDGKLYAFEKPGDR